MLGMLVHKVKKIYINLALYFQVMSDVFSITLSPDFDYSVEFYPYLSGIKEGIRIIDRIYKNAFGDKEKFQR